LLIVLMVGVLLLLNRVTFDLTSAAGRFCHGTPGLDLTKEVTTVELSGFRTSDLCWPSGIVLKKGHRYEITIAGLPADGSRQLLLAPLRRWWSADWFQPIARIGDVGNVEKLLEPPDDAAPTDRDTLRARIVAEADGELFLFVNDAVISIPGRADTFMKENPVTDSVKVRRLGLRNAAAQ
jgi:hypothetical protein